MNLHRGLVRFLAVLTLASASLLPGAARIRAQEPPVRLTIVHDTHLHGSLTGLEGVTLAHYAGLARQIRAENPNTLVVGNGDDLAPSLMSALFHGEHMVEGLNALGLDADTFGNHEFDYGPDNLLERVRASKFRWVTANVLDRRTGDAFGAELGVKRFTVTEVGGVKVGLTGVAPAETPTATTIGPNVEVRDPAAALAEVVPQMRAAGAQVTIVLSHLAGPTSEAVAASVPGIDVIVGDHASQVLEQPKVINGTIVSRRGDELKLLGQLDLMVQGGSIASWTYTGHQLTKDLPADEAVAAVIARYRQQMDARLNEVVGATTVALDARRTTNRSMETNLGNLLADTLRAWGSADVGMQNGGGIRGDREYGPGELTRGDIVSILPFANYAGKVRLTGEALRAALENGVSQIESGGGRFPQVSGITFSVDPTAPVGSRVSDVLVGGVPLDPAASYTLATNDFMLNGGDGYEMFKAAEILVPSQAGPLLANLLIETLQSQGSIAPRTDGRIRVLGGS